MDVGEGVGFGEGVGVVLLGTGVAGVEIEGVGEVEFGSGELFEQPASSSAANPMQPMAASFRGLVDMMTLQGQSRS